MTHQAAGSVISSLADRRVIAAAEGMRIGHRDRERGGGGGGLEDGRKDMDRTGLGEEEGERWRMEGKERREKRDRQTDRQTGVGRKDGGEGEGRKEL